jgi:hypothetical protein
VSALERRSTEPQKSGLRSFGLTCSQPGVEISGVDSYGNRQRSLISVFDCGGASVFANGDADCFDFLVISSQMTEFSKRQALWHCQ